MKKYLFAILLFILLPFAVQSQNINLSEKDIIGRWIEIERIEGDQITEITVNNDTYIFKENQIFHKGESSEGLILFNIAGKYTIEENSIVITYKDYLDKAAKNLKPKTIRFEVLFIDADKDELTINIRDYDYEYQMKLKRL